MEAALHEFIVIIYLFLCAAKLPNCKVCRRRRRCLTGGIQNGCSLFVENDRAGKTCERQRHSGKAIRRPASQGGGSGRVFGNVEKNFQMKRTTFASNVATDGQTGK